MRILVADDSHTMLAIVTAALEKLGHQVVAVTSGQEAVTAFQQQHHDLVILDVMMQGMDGFECAKQLRALNRDDWIPIIFLSGSVDDKSIAQGIDAGGDDYITKPFSEITLAAKIKAMQRIADMRQKLYETTQRLYLQSTTDALTQIANRWQFDRTISNCMKTADQENTALALLFIDLDNFKNVNDGFGHHIGDLLLIEVSKRLQNAIRKNDFVARMGGDEFAIILKPMEQVEDAGHIAQHLIDVISKIYILEEYHLRIGASVGIAYYYPNEKINPQTLVQYADIAMYHAKAQEKNNYQFYTPNLYEKYRQQINVEHALKFAIENNELFLHYQPIFDLHTKKISGLETLIGWNHPKFGIIPPSVFIPISEEVGSIIQIGNWVLTEACKNFQMWNLGKYANFKFSINLSSRESLQNKFFENFIKIITELNIPVKSLEIELTESAVMSYTSGPFKDTVKQLSDYGINISVDDFGTGYSSLVRLKHLPINTLKIDQSFVNDAPSNQNSAIIVRCLIALGKNLNLNVIAEGIETKEQLDFLIANQCPQGQGFYLGKPIEVSEMEAFLLKNS